MKRIPLHPSMIITWGTANLEAWRGRSERIQPIHFLSALLRILDDAYQHDAMILGASEPVLAEVEDLLPTAREILDLDPKELTELRRKVRASYLQDESRLSRKMLHRSDESRRLFERAISLASIEGSSSVKLTHLLYELIRQPPVEAVEILGEALKPGREVELGVVKKSTRGKTQTPVLDALGRDLTRIAKEGKLPAIVGRRDEMLACARTLLRTSKRNVILVGDAGVGKTAIVEGLAQHLLSEDAPEDLGALRIVELSLPEIVAGTRYRGDMEERMQRVLEEASEDLSLVLFLDEIHLVVGAGQADAAPMDIANILKPALSRGEIRCIGATTTEEYNRYIKNDSAFNRRFQIVRVGEPSLEDAFQICSAWAERIEAVQGIEIEEPAIRAAVELSDRLIRDRFLPDKAIDILENAATWIKLPSLSFSGKTPMKDGGILKREDIVTIIEEHYGITVTTGDLIDIDHLESGLRADLVGQPAAIDELVHTLRSLMDSKRDPDRPLGILMFIGPTGVGKTYTAELLSVLIFGEEAKTLGRFNMNEYKERHELARLIGAPPGFVGHGESGALFQHLQRHPQGIILLDEMEKAHPEIQDYFLQIFDTGESRDPRGRVADFRQQFIVMTANIDISGKAARQLGFKADTNVDDKKELSSRDALLQFFRPEFVARLDHILRFEPIGHIAMLELLKMWVPLMIDEITDGRSLKIDITDDVLQHIAKEAVKLEQGVRGLRDIYLRALKTPLKELIQEKKLKTVSISVEADKLTFNKK